MKNILQIIVLSAILGLWGNRALIAQSAEQEPLKAYEGIYLGFFPTDESAVGAGEMEITIKGKENTVRMATGLRIQEEKMNVAEFVQLTIQEVKKIFKDGSEYSARTVGFRTKNGFPILLFLKDPKENEFGLVVSTEDMGAMLGHTILFSPAQIARGDYEKALQNIEKRAGKGVLPRLQNEGKAKNH